MRRRIEELHQRERGQRHRSRGGSQHSARKEQQEDQARLQKAHRRQRIAQADEIVAEQPEREASGRDRLLARALVAVMAGGLGAYLLATTDPFAIVTFGAWPLGVLGMATSALWKVM